MDTMKKRSIRKNQRLLVGSVLVLTLLIIINVIVSSVLQSSEKKIERVLRIQKTFVDMLSLEQQVLNGTTHYANLLVAGQDISLEFEEDVTIPDSNLFREREYLFSKIIQSKKNIENSYLKVRNILPEMVEEVRSIH